MNNSVSRIEEDGVMTPRATLLFSIQEEAQRRGIKLDYEDLIMTIGKNSELYSSALETEGFNGIFSWEHLLAPSVLQAKESTASRITQLTLPSEALLSLESMPDDNEFVRN